MLEAIRKFFQTSGGRVVAGLGVVIALVIASIAIKGTFGASAGEQFSNDRVFIDASTGKTFNLELKPGMTFPVQAPSGGKTGYPAEKCFWTKDGQTKTDPTYVLLDIYKGSHEPTFCPDCGRLVVPHNPAPGPGVKPPPTKQEYKSSNNDLRDER